MLSGLRWLALEVKYLDRARAFYTDHLGLAITEETDEEIRLDAGAHELILRRSSSVPRGGLHTHYAFAIPGAEYDDRWADLEQAGFELAEYRFGTARSLYLDDPDDHCVEFGERGEGQGITAIFEIVLEVADLGRAERFYTDLGFEPVDRGSNRERVRLTGPVDLELWEPHLGLADARGGVHVDVGFSSEDPVGVAETVSDRACSVESIENGARVLDPDGHYLTIR
ncbi:VOC family protein [Natronorarus salvus]|uniref:VOC family protein n=1 Tax=Natronorarus salvus TaxID=3117733 RepID=UPI002F260790